MSISYDDKHCTTDKKVVSLSDLNGCQMKMHRCLIWKFSLFESKQGHNTSKAPKYFGMKYFDDQTRSLGPKIVDSEAGLLAIEPNPVSNTWRVSGISQSSDVRHQNYGKFIRSYQIVP